VRGPETKLSPSTLSRPWHIAKGLTGRHRKQNLAYCGFPALEGQLHSLQRLRCSLSSASRAAEATSVRVKPHRRSSPRAKWLNQLGEAGAGFAPALFLLAVPRGAVPMASRRITQASVFLKLPIENQTHAAQPLGSPGSDSGSKINQIREPMKVRRGVVATKTRGPFLE
jgi:hypothetical protein